MTRRTFITIFIIGVLLRIFWINVPPLWYDENFTLILARLPFDQMLKATAGDVHPPLWYLIEWTIFHIAPNLPAWFIRVPALIFSIGSLLCFVVVIERLDINPQVQTAAFFLMAVMPFQLWYAQEGRMYAMLEFFVLFTLAAALDRKYILLFIGSLGLLYTQNYGPFYMAAIALALAVRENIALGLFLGNLRKYNWGMAAMMSAGVLWIPWYRVVSQQMTDISGRYWIMDSSIGAVLTTLYKLFLTAAVPSEFFFASYVVTFVALTLGVIAIWKSSHPARVTVAFMAFTPLFIAWIVSLVWQPVLLFRPLIGVSPFLYLVVSWSLIRRRTMPDKYLQDPDDVKMGVTVISDWKPMPYTGDKPEWKPDENYVPQHPLGVQLIGLIVWLSMYLAIPVIILFGLWLLYSFITTPTALRTPFELWLTR